MKNLLKIILIMMLITNNVLASDVFLHPSCARCVMNSIPDFGNSVRCKFSQTKTIPNSPVVLNSGGDFVFDKNRGVIFYTKYPVNMTTAYNRNEQVNKIINDIVNRNYSSLEKNFDFYFVKSNHWELGLVPRNSQMKRYVKRLYISGDNKINVIEIKNVDGSSTRINFKES